MYLDSYNCVLCLQNTEETCEHLFSQCQFAWQCWRLIHIDIPPNEDFPEVTLYLRKRLQSQFFLPAPTVHNGRRVFNKEILLMLHRVKSSLGTQFDQWIQTLV
ncbi:hypothetical protein BDA96_10G162000 [Sorghum bicolor]|uniref:Reverse transcriptase zinc-binding domain-containing protein n=1 Tax=Sorghum bicolor TaxID=4558 RepID=A0A921Q3D1_SORBI|nr:hypothetical protein BDA96_10G162000 [Sorghum bicolor]